MILNFKWLIFNREKISRFISIFFCFLFLSLPNTIFAATEDTKNFLQNEAYSQATKLNQLDKKNNQENPAHKNIAFLIEGNNNGSNRFFEVNLAITLAKANDCQIFDTISSYDTVHLSQVLKNSNEKEQKFIVLSIYTSFSGEGSNQNIIDKIIKPSFKQLLTEEFISKIPEWLTSLTSATSYAFVTTTLEELFPKLPLEKQITLFKEKNKNIIAKITEASNSISGKNFMEYLNNNVTIDTIYGLIGKAHLSMLDSYGKVITSSENHRHMLITMHDGRVVNVHLWGGMHGNMEHYNNMKEFLTQVGLIVPEVSKPEINVTLYNDILNLLDTKIIKQAKSSGSFTYGVYSKLENGTYPQTYTPSMLAQNFDYWMKNYNHYGKLTDNQRLLEWLYQDNGAKYIENYPFFCELAKEVAKLKSNIGEVYQTETPPSEIEFNKAIQEYSGVSYSKLQDETYYQTYTPSVLAQNFDYWMKNYNHYGELTDNQRLLEWLYQDNGAKYIENYPFFCDLAKEVAKLKSNIGEVYQTEIPPSEIEFNKAIQEYRKVKE